MVAKRKVYHTRIELPPFKAVIDMVVGPSDLAVACVPEEFQAQLGSVGIATCQFQSGGEGEDYFRCCIHSTKPILSLIAHEAVHASGWILSSMGVSADFDNDEVQAYLVQYIVERAEDLLNK